MSQENADNEGANIQEIRNVEKYWKKNMGSERSVQEKCISLYSN